MSKTYDDIIAIANGADFVRADLHIHSVASTEDVSDSRMTPENIVDTAVAQGLKIISITDHHSTVSIRSALSRAAFHDDAILVIPGVEVTTSQGHLLVYFGPDGVGELEKFVMLLDLVADHQGTRTNKSMIDVITLAKGRGGISVAAHIDTLTGFEIREPKHPAWKKDLICHPGLYGLEFRSAPNSNWYSVDEPQVDSAAAVRRQYASERAKVDKVRAGGNLARFVNSDAHTLEEFVQATHTTRVKISELGYGSFLSALADPHSRIQIEAGLPSVVPTVQGLSIDGGFLDGASVHFSPNLNVFFGGRGTGKSTAVKAIAYSLERSVDFPDGVPFDAVTLWCEGAGGIQYRFDCDQDGISKKRIRLPDGSTSQIGGDPFPIDYFGQGELSRVGRLSLVNQESLQAFLDRHVDLQELVSLESSLEFEAREIVRQLAPMQATMARRKPLEVELHSIEEQLKASEKTKIKAVAEYQNRLSAQRSYRNNLIKIAETYEAGISLRRFVRDPIELRQLSQLATFTKPTGGFFLAVESVINEANSILVSTETHLCEELRKYGRQIADEVAKIDVEHNVLDEHIRQYTETLRQQGLASNVAEYVAIAKRKEALVEQIAAIDSIKPFASELSQRYSELVAELSIARQAITDRRLAQQAALNKEFANTLKQYRVVLMPDQSGIRVEFAAFVDSYMNGSFYPQDQLQLLCATVAPAELAERLEGPVEALTAIAGIGSHWAPHFTERMNRPDVVLTLRLLWKPYLPVFRVWDLEGAKQEINFAALSDGQKNTILLTVALLSSARHPLIIDQPEDDLDNRFVADIVVATLRSVKERRQIILVTHNANIAVLADSEQLLAMERKAGLGTISSRGSIDDTIIRRAVQDTLEGGAAAFRRRQEVYG